jgi:response regulator RpfG family c-di-GMP phosphodiesterase
VYNFFKISDSLKKRNELLSLFPIYNPLPVFVFNNYGKIIFENNPSKQDLPNIKHIKDICPQIADETKKYIKNEITDSLSYSNSKKNKFYAIIIKGIKEKNILIAYAQDITDAIKTDKEIIRTQKEIVYTMGEIGGKRSKETGNHVKRVAMYSFLLAKKLGMSEKEANFIKMASLMHDIGKVGIPDSILNKPGKLDKNEWGIMKTYAKP